MKLLSLDEVKQLKIGDYVILTWRDSDDTLELSRVAEGVSDSFAEIALCELRQGRFIELAWRVNVSWLNDQYDVYLLTDDDYELIVMPALLSGKLLEKLSDVPKISSL